MTTTSRVGRAPWTRRADDTSSAMAIYPHGRFKRHSGTCRCSSRESGTAGRPTSGRPSGRRSSHRISGRRPVWRPCIRGSISRASARGTSAKRCRRCWWPEARGLSATTITRLKAVWEQEYQDWSKRSLAHRSYAYVWADGVYFNVRLEDTDNKRQCILVLMGATPGRTEGAHRDHRWLPGERTVVARAAAGRPAPRAHDRSRAGHRGRRPRLLGRGAERVSADPGAALLGPQDGQCAEHASHGRAAQGESHALRPSGWQRRSRRPTGPSISSWPRLPRSSQPRPRVSPRTGTCA